MAAPYSTAVYPYPAAMWDEAAEHLQTQMGWNTVLIVAPNLPAIEQTARDELAARGLTVNALVVMDLFSASHVIRISRRRYIEPRWDETFDHLTNHDDDALLVVDLASNPSALMDEAREAMAERGIRVSVGLTTDQSSGQAILRVSRAS